MPPSGGPPSVGSILATTLPAATAISVFGTLYGAGARSLLGAGRAIGSSLGRATGAAAERTLLVSGVVCYLAWQVGTVIGLMGAGLPAVAGMAGAIFPVLFIGLASLACRSRTDAGRALAAAALTAGMAFVLPGLRALAPVVVGVLVALPRRKPGRGDRRDHLCQPRRRPGPLATSPRPFRGGALAHAGADLCQPGDAEPGDRRSLGRRRSDRPRRAGRTDHDPEEVRTSPHCPRGRPAAVRPFLRLPSPAERPIEVHHGHEQEGAARTSVRSAARTERRRRSWRASCGGYQAARITSRVKAAVAASNGGPMKTFARVA